jgi:anion-transporting  ArsA/GET3 family ATPase
VYIGRLARKILDSVVYQRFYAAAPGLPELMVLGKIMTLVEAHDARKRPRYDVVIVDAPATGHGLAFLKVPLAASIAIPIGPVGNNARKILALLRDPVRTALALVAIPEEMAVVEAIEFHQMAKSELQMQPRAVFLNAAHEARLSAAQESEVMRLTAAGAEGRLAPGVDLKGALPAARRHVRRRKMTAFYRRLLQRSLVETPLCVLPYLFAEELDLAALRVLAERMEAA